MQEAEGAPKPLVVDLSPAHNPKSKDTLSKGTDKSSDKGEGHRVLLTLLAAPVQVGLGPLPSSCEHPDLCPESSLYGMRRSPLASPWHRLEQKCWHADYTTALDKIADDKPSGTETAAGTGVLAAAADYVHSGARSVAETAHQYTDADDGKLVSVMHECPEPLSHICAAIHLGSKSAAQPQRPSSHLATILSSAVVT